MTSLENLFENDKEKNANVPFVKKIDADILLRMSGELDSNRLFSLLTTLFLDLLKADRSVFLLVIEGTSTGLVQFEAGQTSERSGREWLLGKSIPLDLNNLEKFSSTPLSSILLNDQLSTSFHSHFKVSAGTENNNFLVLPLWLNDKLRGLLYLSKTQDRFYLDSEEVQILELYLKQAAHSLQNCLQYNQLREEKNEVGQSNEQLTQQVQKLKGQLDWVGRELAEAQAVVGQAIDLRTRFLANMSHELRTPLNAIINFSALPLLHEQTYGSLTERQRYFLQRIQANADYLLGLINDILDLARIEAGRLELIYEEVELPPLLQGVMSTAVGLTKDKQLELVLDIPDNLPFVMIDKTRVRQVLLNLLSNAAKFTIQGSITLRGTLENETTVCIAVQDTGIGIPPEHQAIIFEEFEKKPGEQARRYGGTGLGLPISKRLVELHGGRMWVESSPGAGTLFAFTLPVAPEKKVRQNTKKEQGPSDSLLVDERPTVVLVDDDKQERDDLTSCLAQDGFHVYALARSRQIFELSRHIHPQLIVINMMMLSSEDRQVLEELQQTERLKDVPVIVCAMDDLEGQLSDLGIKGYLPKPTPQDLLITMARHWISTQPTILIVDDSPDARGILQAMLELSGYHVLQATSGMQALTMVHTIKPSLMILDLMMPQMDGFALLAWLREDPQTRDLPIIISTSRDLSLDEQQWLLDHNAQLQQKPFMTGTFLLSVANVLGRKEIPHV